MRDRGDAGLRGPRCPRPRQSCCGCWDARPPAGPWGLGAGIKPSGMPRAAPMYNGLVHIKAVPSSALQQSWTDSSHRGWVFRGHQQSQDQARGDTALLTSGLASSPSTLPLEAPTAPSPRRVLLGPFIAFFPPRRPICCHHLPTGNRGTHGPGNWHAPCTRAGEGHNRPLPAAAAIWHAAAGATSRWGPGRHVIKGLASCLGAQL